jgi:cytochrome c
MRLRLIGIALLCLAPGTVLAQDTGAGERVFAQCRGCHQVGPTARNGVGPHLNGVVGRQAGSIVGYAFSPALKNSGLTWDEATFTDYTRDPRIKVPGTKMVYAGLKDEQRIKDLIAYLKQFDATGTKAP